MADDLGFADVGYHNDDVSTPVLDQLADNGIKLNSFIEFQNVEETYFQTSDPVCAWLRLDGIDSLDS